MLTLLYSNSCKNSVVEVPHLPASKLDLARITAVEQMPTPNHGSAVLLEGLHPGAVATTIGIMMVARVVLLVARHHGLGIVVIAEIAAIVTEATVATAVTETVIMATEATTVMEETATTAEAETRTAEGLRHQGLLPGIKHLRPRRPLILEPMQDMARTALLLEWAPPLRDCLHRLLVLPQAFRVD